MDVLVVNIIPKSLSGETNQDSEPSLSVNPADPRQIVGSAFTPDPLNGPLAPIFTTTDGGNTWALNLIVPGALPGRATGDITLRFGGRSNVLYAGILRGDTGALNILRTPNYLSSTPMTVLEARSSEDQPWVRAITAEHIGGTPDRVYVGNNNFGANPTATIDFSLDAATGGAPAGFAPSAITNRIPSGQDGPPIRPVVHQDGTVYAVLYNWTTPFAALITADVVLCRDDNWGQGVPPFSDLVDPIDNLFGLRLARNVQIPWSYSPFIGQERMVNSNISVAVDPRNSSVVYVAWADLPTGVPPYSIHLRGSRDRGVTWSSDLRTVANGINPALAINVKGHIGFLYQTLTDAGATWETHVEISDNGFAGTWWTAVLAAVPSNVPTHTFLPYLGDYVYLEAVGKDFYGVFSANNTPDHANFPNGVVYQRNANFATHTLLDVDDVTPVPVSIDPFFFKVMVKPGAVATAIASGGNFGNVCLGSFVDQVLTINNSGWGPLSISNIISSSPDFLTPDVISYPLRVRAGGSLDVVIRFEPTSFGPKAATLTVISDDPAGPHKIAVFGVCQTPRLSLVIANTGNLGKVCVGSFVDEPLILSNSGKCTLSVSGITSSSAEFLVPEVLPYPVTIGAGDSLPVPIRFEPASFGPKSATLTVTSDDPAGPRTIAVSGDAPSGKLAVTGSTDFGGVQACCRADRTISICNVGDCKLHVTSVGFKRKNRHWKLINNPFPATLHPGSCLCVVIRYKATERVPKACEIVIHSNDPHDPIKCLDVMAYTIWSDCCCKQCCEDCRQGCCEKPHKECCCEERNVDCCDEDEEDEN